MSREVAVGAIGGATAAVAVVSAVEAEKWISIANTIAQSSAATTLILIILMVGLGFLLWRQYLSGEDCEERTQVLMEGMRTLYTLLAADERYSERLGTWDEFVSGIDARTLARAGRPGARTVINPNREM